MVVALVADKIKPEKYDTGFRLYVAVVYTIATTAAIFAYMLFCR
jgi:hypothetical protein